MHLYVIANRPRWEGDADTICAQKNKTRRHAVDGAPSVIGYLVVSQEPFRRFRLEIFIVGEVRRRKQLDQGNVQGFESFRYSSDTRPTVAGRGMEDLITLQKSVIRDCGPLALRRAEKSTCSGGHGCV